MKSWLSLLLLACTLPAMAQLTQTVRGTILEKETKMPLMGAVVTVKGHSEIGAASDIDGHFELANVPVGKQTISFSLISYQPLTLPDVLVTSGREVLLEVMMEESTRQIEEVVVKSKKTHINEMAVVSSKTFDVQETERYAGSRADPARMASNFAGVQGADDSRNDIIIRGNSPQGLLWRLEDVDIPSPNHFSVPGTTGGPVSMLNNKTLANSEFFTGAFPSEYGNSTAGVFDLKLRNGNTKRYEVAAQIGFLGTEHTAEGPISQKKGSSFLISYRYSTLQLFDGLNIPIGTNSVPRYQDGSFKLNFPLGKKSSLSFFGIGGLSKIDLIVSTLKEPTQELYGESDRDQYFTSNTGIIGGSFQHTINSNAYTKITIAQTGNKVLANHDKVFRNASFQVDSMKPVLGYNFTTRSTVAHWFVNRKFGARHTVRAGLMNTLYDLDMTDSSRQFPPTRQDWQQRINYSGITNLSQAYIQYKYRPQDNLTFTAGLHGQYLSHNGAASVEPRLGMRWRMDGANSISFGYGLHSQTQQLYQYFSHLPQQPATAMHNKNLGFTRSHHVVAGWEHLFSNTIRVRTEAYYQHLFNIPIEHRAGSSFTALNQGASFSRLFPDTLYNEGTGYNYGLELTVEKTFSNGYYFLFTGSLFDSKAKGYDGVYRKTDYNTGYAMNLLGGYEYKLNANSTLITGAKITWAGGRLYSPPNVAASNAVGDFIVIDSLRNTERFPDYFRADVRLAARFNRSKVTHEFGLDLVNILGTKNLLSLTYSAERAAQNQYPFTKQYQLGFLPLFYYRLDFGWKAGSGAKEKGN